METKYYDYNMPPEDKSDEELLSAGKKYQIIGFAFMLFSLFFFKYGGFVTFIVGIVLFTRKRKYIKMIAYRKHVQEVIKTLEAPEPVEIIPNLDFEQIKRRPISKMPIIDFTTIRKNTPLSKIFPLVVIDVETTGLSRQNNKIIEVSAYKYENNFEPTQRFSTLINPEIHIPKEATEINNITDSMVVSAPTFAQIASQLQDFIKDCNIAGYNVRFDLEFLYMSGIDFSENVLYFDVYELAKKKIRKSEVENYKLQTICEKLGIDILTAHRSLCDCFATGKLFETLVMKDRA